MEIIKVRKIEPIEIFATKPIDDMEQWIMDFINGMPKETRAEAIILVGVVTNSIAAHYNEIIEQLED